MQRLPLAVQSMLLLKFRTIFESYRRNLLGEFKQLNKQKRAVWTYCEDFLRRVNSFLLIEDERRQIVFRFQKDYNLFLSNWPDLIFKEITKAEYHKR